MSAAVFAFVTFRNGRIGFYLAEDYVQLDGREIETVKLVSTCPIDPVERFLMRAMVIS